MSLFREILTSVFVEVSVHGQNRNHNFVPILYHFVPLFPNFVPPPLPEIFWKQIKGGWHDGAPPPIFDLGVETRTIILYLFWTISYHYPRICTISPFWDISKTK